MMHRAALLTLASALFVAPALAAQAADWQHRSIYQVRSISSLPAPPPLSAS
jgi:hypothetical protein